MELIRPFEQLGKDDAGIAGGKGASLGEMTQVGIPVPPGFVILANAFERFLEEADLNQELDAILQTVDHNAIHTVEHASEKIKQLILNAEMPVDIADAIQVHHKQLGAEFVAVRSSATAEDGATAAWAGQLDTYLNTTQENLLENVKHCWASLFTSRAIFYRFEKGMHGSKISVAVVVQKMIQSEVSGIAFSVHPVTEDHNHLIIEAGFGLGEAIVSGQVTPDSYVVEKVPRRIIDKNVSTQIRSLIRANGGIGNEWVDIQEPKASSQVLTDDQVLELSELVLTIEKHYGFPCDIEWAYEAGSFYITQSRPITTLTLRAVEKTEFDFLRPVDFEYVGLYKCSPFALWYWSAWYAKDLADELGVPHEPDLYFGLKGGHTFSRLSSEVKFASVMREKVEAGDIGYFSALCSALERESKNAEQFGSHLHAELTAQEFEKLIYFGRRLLFFCFVAWQNSNHFDALFKSAAKDAGILEEEIGGYIPAPRTQLTEQHNDVIELKKLLQENGIWDLLKENPSHAIRAIRSNSELWPYFEAHLKKFEWLNLMNWIGEPLSLEKLLEQMTFIQPTSLIVSSPPKSLEKYVEIARHVAFLRNAGIEHLSIYTNQVMKPLQNLAATMGISYRDFLLLIPTEIFIDGHVAVDYKEKIARRQNENWFIYADPSTEEIRVTDNSEAVESIAERFLPKREVNQGGVLKGQVGNKGKVRGPVRIIIATDDFGKMKDGDVLVTPMTTPDFILLMQKSAAIVTDMGGLLCHAAIVSRELNKPCVIDTKFATQVLKDGDMVEVDANAGIVRKLS